MDFDNPKKSTSDSQRGAKVIPGPVTSSVDTVPVTIERKPYQPGTDKPRLAQAGIARANLAATYERPEGTTEDDWARRHRHQTVLQQHCDFFDE
ncbi:hypothetical protein ACHAPI_011938, partial [Fusarium lateritium]